MATNLTRLKLILSQFLASAFYHRGTASNLDGVSGLRACTVFPEPQLSICHPNSWTASRDMSLDFNQLQKPVRKLRKLLKNARKEPLPEQVHDLRTNTRRLEAALASVSCEPRPEHRKLLKELGRIRKRAGKVRDMDVLTGFAASVRVPDEGDCSVQLLEYLGAEREKQAKRLHAAIGQHRGRLRELLKRTGKQFEAVASAGNHDADDDATSAAASAAASALVLESELAEVARLSRQNLHPYRLKVKELRNVLRLAQDGGNDTFIETLGTVKNAIGEWHDWQELVGIAEQVLDHGPQCKLVRELKRISDAKYDHALAETEKMRRKYLRISGKKKPGRQPAPEVWKATAAIAA
jgi:CHAD domain-containing protein